MNPVRVVVVESTTRPGQLSLRAKTGDRTATAWLRELTESGAKPGDVLELRQVLTKEQAALVPVAWEEVGEAELGRLGESVAHVWTWTGTGFCVQIKSPGRRLRTFRCLRPFPAAKALAEKELRLAEARL